MKKRGLSYCGTRKTVTYLDVKRELSKNNTIKQVCQWMEENNIAPYVLGDIINFLLGTDKFTCFYGTIHTGIINEIFIIKDYKGQRDIGKENIVLSIKYKERLFRKGKYILPKEKANISVKKLA